MSTKLILTINIYHFSLTFFYLVLVTGVEYAEGLFRYCKTTKSYLGTITTCYNRDSTTDKFRAVQAFMILSVLTSIAAVVFGIIHMVSDKIPAKLVSLLMVIIFVLALIGLAIYTEMKEDTSYIIEPDYGWAYGLGWVGALAALIVGIVVFAVCN